MLRLVSRRGPAFDTVYVRYVVRDLRIVRHRCAFLGKGVCDFVAGFSCVCSDVLDLYAFVPLRVPKVLFPV